MKGFHTLVCSGSIGLATGLFGCSSHPVSRDQQGPPAARAQHDGSWWRSAAAERSTPESNQGDDPTPTDLASDKDILIHVPWHDIKLPTVKCTKTVQMTHPGGDRYAAYGPDPMFTKPSIPNVSAVISGGGDDWKLDTSTGFRGVHGFSYLWGYWRLFETERTRTITWGGASVAGRSIPASDGLPQRDQIFVLCGEVEVSSKDVPNDVRIVTQGQYVWAADLSGTIVLNGPYATPTAATSTPPDSQSILDFLQAMKQIEADPCNP